MFNIDNYCLSIILPFYKKINEFKRVLPRNAKYFERNGIEVIIVIDEPTEQQELLNYIKHYPFINWKIMVNEKEHSWRNPAKVINVGIRNSTKEYIMVMSPESEIINDSISLLRKTLHYYPDHFAIGRVICLDLDTIVNQKIIDQHLSFQYGSIMVRKEHFLKINGYSEVYTEWGGEDTNLRARLELNGIKKYYCEDAVLVHREDFNKAAKRKTFDKTLHKERPYGLVGTDKESKDYLKEIWCPENNITNDDEWGKDFEKIIYDYKNNVYSKELCEIYLSGLKEYEILNKNMFKDNYKIIALVQAYNENKTINDFLKHLDEHCDGIILLDDESTDGTYYNAHSNKLLMKIRKKRKEFNDLENRNILLNIASFIKSAWFYFIDVDERFDARFGNIYSVLKKKDIHTVQFNLVHLWDSIEYFRTDYPYSKNGIQGKLRMFKNIGRTQIKQNKKLHFQPVPYIKNLLNSDILIQHYGLLKKENRIEKFNFYANNDKQNDQKSYDHLIQKDVRIENISNLKIKNN
jgi:hypothetical protein